MLAIIPARGGSKGLPGKNIKLMNGKPLIVYTFEAAKNSKFIDRIILSTDDDEIAGVAKQFDIEVPFMRPSHLATDDALAIDNYLYTIERLNSEQNNNILEFCVLQPTSPLRIADDIDNSIELFYKENADSVISIYENPHPPIWSKKIDSQGKLSSYFDLTSENKNRQELVNAYLPNGAIFVFKYSLLKEKRTYYSEHTFGYIMPNNRSIDIDNKLDFEFAEFLLKKGNE